MLKQIYSVYSEQKPSYNQTQHQIILINLKIKKKKKIKQTKETTTTTKESSLL